MNTLTGVELDAAVASVLGIAHLSESFMTNPPKPVAVWRLLDSGKANYEAGPFNPSVDANLAMQLLIDQKITLLYSPNWDEKNNEIPNWAAGWHYYDCDDFEMESEGTGATPQEAICRAIVRRAEDQAREAERQAAEQAENERREAVRAVAWDRANHTRATRTPWAEFANEEEQAAYRWALDQQLEFIRKMNSKETEPMALPHPTELL